ncbi:permease [Clostridium sp. SHJSY1]|uniref:permease n=1 Tax=Clostridium sp. SHJSY1 TaxID=2942483 RepID=UPI002875339F|nr:permease [Clostridium sp. SHJSY1]MDS0524665.1 permease [Clostridium sp. SHJSY1]
MKIKVDILFGFLGSGKTTLIKSFIENGELKDETVVILQYELGKIIIKDEKSRDKIILIERKIDEPFNKSCLKEIISKYTPDRIIIEYNGMGNTEKFLQGFNDPYLERMCKIHKIITTIDMRTANMYLLNMANKIREHIVNSDIIILNNDNNINKDTIQNIKRNIRQINEVAKIHEFPTIDSEEKSIRKRKLCLNSGEEKVGNKEILLVILGFTAFFCVGLFFPLISDFGNNYLDKNWFDSFNKIFMGILIETLPFILIGAFLSSIIQIFISENTLAKIFPRNKIMANIVAAFSGILFPVCDCGTIPVARGFLKKGLPLSVAITFMLSAPIVNPIAIISTLYAFPDMKYIVVYRLVLGIIISIIVGLIMNRYSSKEVVNDYIINCQCDLCSGEYASSTNIFIKIKGVFLLTGDEFINVGKYMIVGALASASVQTLIGQKVITFIPEGKIPSLILMMAFAFVFSVCSTSDAFIAKGFLNQFSKGSVLGFLVLGPMIDIKNTMMLLGSFKKSFVIKLLSLIVFVSFILLMIVPL